MFLVLNYQKAGLSILVQTIRSVLLLADLLKRIFGVLAMMTIYKFGEAFDLDKNPGKEKEIRAAIGEIQKIIAEMIDEEKSPSIDHTLQSIERVARAS